MNAKTLIKEVENFCNERKIEVSKMYERLAELYQDEEYGTNIVMQMEIDGYYDMAYYLESKNIVDRYITILNKIKRGEYNV